VDGGQPFGRPLPTHSTHTMNVDIHLCSSRTQISSPSLWVVKTVCALDCVVTVMDKSLSVLHLSH
jgi:hypothetical protein